MASTTARVQPEATALALVLWAASAGRTEIAAPLIAASTLPQLFTGPVLGSALDRARNPERWVAGCATLATAGCVVLAVSDLQLAPALLAAVIFSVCTPVLTGGLSSVIMGWSDDHSRLAAWDGTGYNIAGLLAPAVVTAVAAWRPPAAFMLLAVFTFLAAAQLATTRTARRTNQTPDTAARPGILDAARSIGRSRALLAVTVSTTMFSLGLGGLELALVAAVDAYQLPPERAGVAATSIAIGALAGSLALTRTRRRPEPVSMTLAAIMASGALLMLLSGVGWPIMIPVAVAIGMADGPLLVATYRARSDYAPAHLRSGVFTLGASAKLGASSIGALLLGAIVADRPTMLGLLAIGGVGILAACTGMLINHSPSSRSLPTDHT